MSIGPLQIIIILAIVLLFFGPKRLPGLAKSLGESIKGFKKALDNDSRDVTDTVASEKLDEASASEAMSSQMAGEKSKQSEKEKS